MLQCHFGNASLCGVVCFSSCSQVTDQPPIWAAGGGAPPRQDSSAAVATAPPNHYCYCYNYSSSTVTISAATRSGWRICANVIVVVAGGGEGAVAARLKKKIFLLAQAVVEGEEALVRRFNSIVFDRLSLYHRSISHGDASCIISTDSSRRQDRSGVAAGGGHASNRDGGGEEEGFKPASKKEKQRGRG